MPSIEPPGDHVDPILLMTLATSEFAKRAAILVVFSSLAFLVWYLRDFFLIVVGSLLVAALLELISEPLVRWGHLPRGLALLIAGLVVLAAIGGSAYLFGTQMSFELEDVLKRADTAMTSIVATLHQSRFGEQALSHLGGELPSVTGLVSDTLKLSVHFIEALIIIVFAGIYLAVQPALYRKGASYLFPRRQRLMAEGTMNDIGRALRLWLLGQLIAMCVVGLLSTLAVWLIGLPSPLALGAIAGIAEFVPYLGPIVASIPAILVAVTKGLYPVLWTIVAYGIIHQVEGNLIAPVIQRHMVLLPPAILLLSIVAISLIFGSFAIVFAAPMTVIGFVAVKKLYIRDSLGQSTSLPGEDDSEPI